MHDIRCLYIKQELRVFSVLSLFANTKLRLEESSILFLLEEGVIMIISVLESFSLKKQQPDSERTLNLCEISTK